VRQIKLVVAIVIALGFLAASPMLKAWPSGFGASPPVSGRGDCDSAAESAHGGADGQERTPDEPRPTPPPEPSSAKPKLTLEHKATMNGIAALTVTWSGLEGDAVLALQIDIVSDDGVVVRRIMPHHHQFEGVVVLRSLTAAGSAGLEIDLVQAQQHLGQGRIAVSALITNRVSVIVRPFRSVRGGGTPEYQVEVGGPDCRPEWEVLCAEGRPIPKVVLDAKPRPFRVPEEGYLDVITALTEILGKTKLELGREEDEDGPTPPSEPSPAKPQLTLEHRATNGIAALTVAWSGLEGEAVLALQIDIVFDDDVLARRETPDEHQFEGLVMVRSATAAGSAGLEIDLVQAQQHLGKGRIAVSALVTNRVLVTVLPFQNVMDGGTPEYHVEIRGPDCRPAWEVLCAEDRPITRVVLNAKPRPFRVPKEGYLDVTTGLNEILARAQLELSRAENDDRVRPTEPQEDKP